LSSCWRHFAWTPSWLIDSFDCDKKSVIIRVIFPQRWDYPFSFILILDLNIYGIYANDIQVDPIYYSWSFRMFLFFCYEPLSFSGCSSKGSFVS
jgi:hypothetical protein